MSKRTAIIVGAASGIGCACARALAAEDWVIAVADRNLDRARGGARMKRYANVIGHVLKLAER
jgi:NAD(P)-dependent dehydrogenase (short-subunit alcohol dehydrogenase family)